jgi:hypothetical protein
VAKKRVTRNGRTADAGAVVPVVGTRLELLSRGRQLLAQARTVDEAREIRDQAQAVALYLRQHDDSTAAALDAQELKLWAERRVGEILAAEVDHAGSRGVGRAARPTLPPGVSKDHSSQWQRVAAVSLDVFQECVASGRENGELTTAGVLRLAAARGRQGAPAGNGTGQVVLTCGGSCSVERAHYLDWLGLQPAASIDLVLTSPPFEDARLYLENGVDLGIALQPDEWVARMAEAFKAALRCCRGLVAFVVQGRTKNYRWSATPFLLGAELHRAGICLRVPPIYHRIGIPGSGGNRGQHEADGGGADWLRCDYEFVLVATAKAGKLPWADATATGQPPKYRPGGDPSHRRQDGSRVNRGGEYATTDDRGNEGPHRARQRAGRKYKPPKLANPGNVITCQVGKGHMGSDLAHENEAPFPESLAEFFIRSFCPPGGTVADPFCGSGTTLAVAKRLGRQGIGCDIRQSQVDLTLRRLATVTPAVPT